MSDDRDATIAELRAQLAAIRAIIDDAGTHAGRLGRIRQVLEQTHVARA